VVNGNVGTQSFIISAFKNGNTMDDPTIYVDPETGVVINLLTGLPLEDPEEILAAGTIEGLSGVPSNVPVYIMEQPGAPGEYAAVVTPMGDDEPAAPPLILPVVAEEQSPVVIETPAGAARGPIEVTLEDLGRPSDARYLGDDDYLPTAMFGKFEEELEQLLHTAEDYGLADRDAVFRKADFERDPRTKHFERYIKALYPPHSQMAPQQMALELNRLGDVKSRLPRCGRTLDDFKAFLKRLKTALSTRSRAYDTVHRAQRLVQSVQDRLAIDESVACDPADSLSTVVSRLAKERENLRVKTVYWGKKPRSPGSTKMLQFIDDRREVLDELSTRAKDAKRDVRAADGPPPQDLLDRIEAIEEEAGLLLTPS
jgi:hypothetical protein